MQNYHSRQLSQRILAFTTVNAGVLRTMWFRRNKLLFISPIFCKEMNKDPVLDSKALLRTPI